MNPFAIMDNDWDHVNWSHQWLDSGFQILNSLCTTTNSNLQLRIMSIEFESIIHILLIFHFSWMHLPSKNKLVMFHTLRNSYSGLAMILGHAYFATGDVHFSFLIKWSINTLFFSKINLPSTTLSTLIHHFHFISRFWLLKFSWIIN